MMIPDYVQSLLLPLTAVLLMALIVYHHVGYPLLLRLISAYKRRQQPQFDFKPRHFTACVGDARVPSIHLVIPVYNEAALLRQKIDSLSWLDYPKDKFKVSLFCDGCNDRSVQIARMAAKQFCNLGVVIEVRDFSENRGKVAMVNQAIEECRADILAFSDASAILASDTLWRAAQHFIANDNTAVVTGDYSLLQQGSEGEGAYWQYQNRIRAMESDLGAVMGAPGAFYAIRHRLCSRLEPDTINDDFILPMRAVAQGYDAVFDAQLNIYETEPSDLATDGQRRIRISQGNTQQLLRLKRLLLPGLSLFALPSLAAGRQRMVRTGVNGWVNWMFISGKALRVLMPYCLLLLLLLSAWLAPSHWLWTLVYLGQLLVYTLVLMAQVCDERGLAHSRILNSKIVRLVSYLFIGHWMGLRGSARYLLNSLYDQLKGLLGRGVKQRRWHKIQ